jgi:integrase
VKGYMRERRPGVWGLEVYLGRDPVTGRKRWKTQTFHGKKRQAQKALAVMVAGAGVERAPATEGTFAYLLNEWMKLVKRDRSPTTHQEYRRIVDKVIVPRLGAIALHDLTPHHLDQLYQAESERISANSVGQVHAICRRALNVAVKWGWIEINPAHRTTPPARTKAEIRPPALQSYFDLLTVADEIDRDFGVLVRVAAATGCRRGELCGLQWGDLDWTSGRLAVRRAVAVVKGAKGRRDVIVKPTKSKQTRTLRLDQDTLNLLAGYLIHCRAWAERDADGLGREAFMFSHVPDRAEPLRPPWVTDAFARARTEAGMDSSIWLHGLRHLNGSLQLAAGVPLATVSGRLGHTVQTTTLGFYSHSMPGEDERAAEKLGALLRPAPAPSSDVNAVPA